MTNDQTFTLWMTLLTVLGGGIVTGVVTVIGIVVTLRHSRKVQQQDFHRQQLIGETERQIRMAARDLETLRAWDSMLARCDAMLRNTRSADLQADQQLATVGEELMGFWRGRNPLQSSYEFILMKRVVDEIESIRSRSVRGDAAQSATARKAMIDAIEVHRGYLQSAIADHERMADPSWTVTVAAGGRRAAD